MNPWVQIEKNSLHNVNYIGTFLPEHFVKRLYTIKQLPNSNVYKFGWRKKKSRDSFHYSGFIQNRINPKMFDQN